MAKGENAKALTLLIHSDYKNCFVAFQITINVMDRVTRTLTLDQPSHY